MTILNYASEALDPRFTRIDRIFFRIALACGILPMTIGLTILALYYLFDWDAMQVTGMFMIPIGGAAVFTGIALAITWCIRQRSTAKRLGTPTRWRAGILVLLLLIANFPVALFCVVAGGLLAMEALQGFSICNHTNDDLTNVTVSISWFHKESFGPIVVGDKAEVCFKPRFYNSIRIHVEQDGLTKSIAPTIPPPSEMSTFHLHVKPGLELEPEISRPEWRD